MARATNKAELLAAANGHWEKIKHFSWTGTTNVGAYCISSAPSHYEWVMKKIKRYQKEMAKS